MSTSKGAGPRPRPPRPLKATQLYKPADLAFLEAASTDDIKPIDGVIEQRRPVDALELGLRVHQRNFHIFVAGPSGSGKMTTTLRLLKRVAPKRPVPPDLVYVHDFEQPEQPMVISLPPGQGARLRRDMERLIEELSGELPEAYHARSHQERIQEILSNSVEVENEAFAQLKQAAAELDFVVRTTKQGLTVLPMVDGKPLAHKEYTDQPREVREGIEARRKQLDPLLSQFIEKSRELELEAHDEVTAVQRAMGEGVVKGRVERLRATYDGEPRLTAWLDGVFEHVLEHLDRFLPDDNSDDQRPQAPGAPFEYRVNVAVDNRKTRGAPVIVEDRPTFYNLFGRIEKRVEYGIYSTDHTMIKAGSLLRANGGYLVLNAADLFNQAGVWDTLKATLRSGQLRIEDLGEAHGFLPTSGIRPEAVPIEVKLILVGNHGLFDALYRHDDDFPKLFRIKAEFDDVIDRKRSTERAYARFVSGVVAKDGLLPMARDGVEAVIEAGSRLAESQRHLTLAFNDLASLIIEADDVCRQRDGERVSRHDVDQAIERRDFQLSYLRDRLFEDLERKHILIDTEGSARGRINALSVYQDGPHTFAKPTRITARAQAGAGGVLSVEREVRLSGRIHDKAVLILGGYLGGKYGVHTPLSAQVTIAFEQSYGPIDGDSASLAELLCVMSDLAQLPLRQDLAVTGSVSQFGDILPIGGANAKIEGFHRTCRMGGLTGTQGVVIPKANVADLMLHRDVRDDVANGRFQVYAVSTVDEAMDLFFGVKAGRWVDGKGFRPVQSVHALVLKRLRQLHEIADARGDSE